MSSSDTDKKIKKDIEKASSHAQDEVERLRREIDDLRRKAGPQLEKAENFLTSPAAVGFYQGVVVGVALVLTYAKVKGGLRF